MAIHQRLFRALCRVVAVALAAAYLVVAGWNDWFPSPLLHRIEGAFRDTAELVARPWYFDIDASGRPIENRAPDRVQPGLVMAVGVGADRLNFIRIMDRDGITIQSWTPDWFGLWPDPQGIDPERLPLSNPGAAIHGVMLAENGDIIFNFEKLSTVRLNACGGLVWKQANGGHHSIERDGDGNLWIPSVRRRIGPHPVLRNIGGPHQEDYLQKMSPDGRILWEKGVFELLAENGLGALLYMSNNSERDTLVGNDIAHLNDIDIYDGAVEGGVVRRGDLLLSLRNISTVLLLDGTDLRVKAQITGPVLRQHDPDFIGGDDIVIYDNNNLVPARRPEDPGSRIVRADLATGRVVPYFEGSGETKFFSNIMGKQQLLENGNLMVTVSKQARAFEVSPQGELLWQFKNLVGDENGAILTEVSVLPAAIDAGFFDRARAACSG